MPDIRELHSRKQLARDREEVLRSHVYANGLYTVAGVEVHAMTLSEFNLLCIAKNPFICGGRTIKEEDAIQLLWIVSEHKESWWKSEPRLKRDFIRSLDDQNLFNDVFEYVDELFMDSTTGKSKSAPIASSVAYFVHRLAEAYCWNRDEILALAIPEVLQYIRLIRKSENPKTPITNRLQDKVDIEYFRELNPHISANN